LANPIGNTISAYEAHVRLQAHMDKVAKKAAAK
jgi:hypothetical protein